MNETSSKLKNYDFLHAVLSNLPAVVFVIAPDGTITFAEGKSIALAGLNRDEVVGTNVSEYFSMFPALEERVCRALAGETLTSISTAPNQRSFEVTYSPMLDERGSICGVIGVAQDIDERIGREQALWDSEETLRSITSAAIDAIFMIDQAGRISLWNDAAQTIFGYTEQEAIGQNFYLFITPQEYRDPRKRGSIASLGESSLTGKTTELIAKRKSGEEFPVELSLSAFRLHDQWHAIGTARDITERKQKEEALRKGEERFKQVAENAGEWIWEVDADGLYTYASPAVEKMLGYKPEEIVGNIHFYDLFVPEEREELKKATLEAMAQHEPFREFVNRNLHKDGSRVILETSGVPILDDYGTLVGYRGADKNITDRTRAEEAQRESEAKFRRIFEEAPLGMTMAAKDFRFLRVNAAFCRMVGYSASELTSLTFKDITHPDHLSVGSEFVNQVFSGEIPSYDTEKRYIRKDKEIIWGALTLSAIRSTDGQFLYFLAMIEDITERKRAQEEKERLQQRLQQSQKLEAIGTMAGGIAHDFNNILTGILGFAELARSEVPEGSPVYDNLAEVVQAGRRARDLVRQILSFSRKAETEKSPVSLATIAKEALKLIRSVIPSHITIRQNYTVSAEHSILADPTQMHQIVMNLCLNAADAMPDGGVLEISVEEEVVETENQLEQTRLPSGRHLKLTVHDSGAGMTPEVLERIFEPYYTTKQANKGTGMGLAVVHGVVKEHGGSIAVFSEPGKGTTVTVCLPIVEAVPCAQVDSAPVITTDNESILFVDDETMIVNLQQSQLGRWGYRVAATASSATALNMFRANPQNFDLVITDLTMPGITGIKLAEAIHEISPSTPIILCTGFDEGISRKNARMIGIHAILTKPITGAELSRTIRLVLDEAIKPSPAKP